MHWIDRLRNVVRQEAQRSLVALAMPRMGIVRNYDPTRYAVRVELQPEGILTGYIPLGSAWVGNGWGLYTAPVIGEMIEVHFQQGGKEAAFAGDRYFNAVDRPLEVPAGELWAVHQSGSAIKLTNDGNILISAHGDLRIEANNIKLHGRQTFAFDAKGQGQKWNGSSVETWQDDDTPGPHHNHAPPETP